MSQRFIVTFNDKESYQKYKDDVIKSGGTIKNDLGTILLGFTADIPTALVETIRSSSLVDNGITSFEPDSVVTIQAQ